MNYHIPVLLEEVTRFLDVRPGCRYVDATLGGGGHTRRMLELGGQVLGIDTDTDALGYVKTHLGAEYSAPQLQTAYGNFRDIARIVRDHQWSPVHGVLFDLGVSSWQFDTPGRGFSYRFESSPLDLRLDQTRGTPAADLINRLSEEELYEVIAKFGEEERARSISRALVSARKVKPIATSGDLQQALVQAHVPSVPEVLSRVYQALRIAVNDELESLETALDQVRGILAEHGRIVIISYHSLEDRRVKRYLGSGGWKELTKKPVMATDAEREQNSRSRSAKLRAAETV